jgi:hypothetical protein
MSFDFEPLNTEPKGKVEIGHGGRYKLPHPITGKETLFTRVSTIAHTVPDTFHLDNWEKRMVAKGMAIWPDLVAAAKGLDFNKDKARLQAIATAAKEIAGIKEGTGTFRANLGSVLHACTDVMEQGRLTPEAIEEEIGYVVQDYKKSLIEKGLDKYGLFLDALVDAMHKAVLKKMTKDAVVADLQAYTAELARNHIELDSRFTERVLLNMEYQIVGRVDRVGTSRFWPQPRICDLKTGGVEYDHTAFLMQTALYGNADYMWNEFTAEWEPFPKVDRSVAQIIHLPVGERSCKIYNSPIADGWAYVRLAMYVREARRRGKDALTPYVDDYTWRVRISEATSVEDLSAIWREATGKKEWTTELMEMGRQKREELNGQ